MTLNHQNQTYSARRVAILGFDDVLLLDIAGLAQVFGSANKILGRTAYMIEIVTRDGAGFTTDTGLRMQSDASFVSLNCPHDLVVPGGPGVDSRLEDKSFRQFLVKMAPAVERVISVCSGSLLTASAGLLDGREATTHWERAAVTNKRFASVKWELDKIFTNDGKFHCSAGVTTGIDLALSLVEQDHGRGVALDVAREMVVFMQRHGGQSQYSSMLKAQSTSNARLSALFGEIETDPSASWTVGKMAEFVGMTERTLHRIFIQELGQSPLRYIEEMRLELARTYLERSRKPFKEVAFLAGFGSEQKMRRSFVKLLGILPSDYRSRFGEARATAAPHETGDS